MKEITCINGEKTQVDDCDYEYLNQWEWNYDPNLGVFRNEIVRGKIVKILMHVEVMKRMIHERNNLN